VTYSKAFFGIAEDEEFNLSAAIDAYEWCMDNPEEAPFVVSKALFDHTTQELIRNKPYIDKVMDAYVSKRLEDAKRGITRVIVSKSRNGMDTSANEALVAQIDLISKAYTTYERAANADKQSRDPGGRFQVMNRRVKGTAVTKPFPKDVAEDMGIAPTSRRLPKERLAAYQNDYLEVQRAIQGLGDDYDLNDSKLKVRVEYDNGKPSGTVTARQALEESLDGSDDSGFVMSRNYAGTPKRVDRILADYEGDPVVTRGISPDALAAAGMGGMAGFASGLTSNFDPESPASSEFMNSWMTNGVDDHRTTDRMWRRMGAAANLAETVGGDNLNPKAKVALDAAQWAGRFAPEAEKVIGPSARRSAYRYRGVEKAPSPVYQNTINTLRENHETGREAHDKLLSGEEYVVPINPGNPQAGSRRVFKESDVIGHMKSILPDPKLYHLNRKSGSIPPSQGIIIDRKGRVVTEAVGYGEDWYVPFNLKNLSRLKGGEYIRTRAFGGPTTEDIYVGLVSGARAVTVVSNSGVFTIEFDDSFRGSRRYNEKSGRMHARYAQLLDAVKSRDVTLGAIPKDRLDEIKQEAAGKFDPDERDEEKQYKQEVERLKIKERENPKLAEASKEAIKYAVLDEHIQESGKGADFSSFVTQQTAYGQRDGNLAEVNEKYSSPDVALETFGLTQRAKKEIDLAQSRYEADLNPLQLNGQGYGLAMDALKDQFPYYVKSTKFTPFQDNGDDFGYVKPRFNRPEGALAGYYDETIEGPGKTKFTADQTNYQNYPVMSQRNFVTEKDKQKKKLGLVPVEGGDTTGAGGPSGPSSPSGSAAPSAATSAYAKNQKVEATMSMVESLRKSRTWAQEFGSFGGQSIGQGDMVRLAQMPEYSMVLGEDMDVLRRKVAEGGSDASKIESQITALRGVLDVDSDVWSNYRAGGVVKLEAKPADTYSLLDGLGTRFYTYPGLKPGQTVAAYDLKLDELLRNSYLKGMGLDKEMTAKEAIPIIRKQGSNLRNAQSTLDARKAGLRTDVTLNIDPATIKKEADWLAKAAQVYAFRDKAREQDAKVARANAPDVEVIVQPGEAAANKLAQQLAGGQGKVEAPAKGATTAAPTRKSAPDAQKVAELRDDIHNMVGMKQVANEVDNLIASAVQAQRREEAGLPVSNRSMHIVFTGSPGTGKTTIAEKLAPLYNELGLIPTDKIVKKSRADLVGGYQGQTAMKTQKAFDEAKGGVLFIDEAYALKNGPDDTYGQEAIDTLLANVENSRKDTVVILAGYPEEMKAFLSQNPGMKSRFPRSIHFNDYSGPELKQISGRMFEGDKYSATKPGVKALINNAVSQVAADPDHANARDVRNLYEAIAEAQDRRVAHMDNPSVEQLQEITAADVRAGMHKRGLELPSAKKQVA
jgi:hypothetical protein